MNEYDKLLQAGQHLKAIITHTQGKFVRATYILKRDYPRDLTEEQLRQIQQEINQATIDAVIYRDLLRRCYEAIGISNPAD